MLCALLGGNVRGDRTLLIPLWLYAQHTVGVLSVFVKGTQYLGLPQALNMEGFGPSGRPGL